MSDKTVKVRARQWHTAFGKEYQEGDEYEIDEDFVDTVVTQGMAVRVNDAAVLEDAGRHERKDLRAKP